MYKIALALIILITFSNIVFSQVTLDPRYHTNEEIKSEIDALQELYPEIVKVESIGVTLTDNLPIWAVKISDNVNIDEDEPAVMYAGQCHAEEVLGVEVTMYMLHDIIEKRNITPYRIWIQEMEMWFVPTYNPEGLSVVMSGVDDSYRKNKTDTNNNGFFDFINGYGNDIDGVDTNRNYSFNWIHGDTLYHPGGEELYDYYRGEAPFSEGGTQAIRNLAEQQHFIFSINWHSSRTGNFSEKVFFSFEHVTGSKVSPDFEYNQEICNTVAGLIQNEAGTGSYEPSASHGRKGSAHDWFYQAHGTTQLLIECGTENLQPDSALIEDTVERCSVGAYWLLNRAIGYNVDSPMLTGIVTDQSTGEPIIAEVTVIEKDAPYFEKRLTDEEFGRYFRQISPGSYTVKFTKKGYEDKVYENIVVNSSMHTTLDAQLIPLAEVTINGLVKLDGSNSAADIFVKGDYPYTVHTDDGYFTLNEFVGDIEFVIIPEEVDDEGVLPFIYNETIETGGIYSCNVDIEFPVTTFNDDFESNLDKWTVNGEFEIVENELGTNNYLDDSPSKFYENNSNFDIQTINLIDLSTNGDVSYITFDHRYYTEHEEDFCIVEISENGTDWIELARYSGLSERENSYWEKEVLAPTVAPFYLRFRVETDGTLNDPGWKIDNVKVVSGDFVKIEEDNYQLSIINYQLKQNYPNPFNPLTRINYELRITNYETAEIVVYNATGQSVWSSPVGARSSCPSLDPNNHGSIQFDGSKFNSGVYYYSLIVDGKKLSTKAMVLIK